MFSVLPVHKALYASVSTAISQIENTIIILRTKGQNDENDCIKFYRAAINRRLVFIKYVITSWLYAWSQVFFIHSIQRHVGDIIYTESVYNRVSKLKS